MISSMMIFPDELDECPNEQVTKLINIAREKFKYWIMEFDDVQCDDSTILIYRDSF